MAIPETLGDCFASLAMTVSWRLYHKRVPTNYILPIILRDANLAAVDEYGSTTITAHDLGGFSQRLL